MQFFKNSRGKLAEKLIAKNGKGPFMLCANLNPEWPGMVSMLAAGGGCHVNCMTKPGKTTIARLNKYKGDYRLTIIPAEFITLPEEKMEETTKE